MSIKELFYKRKLGLIADDDPLIELYKNNPFRPIQDKRDLENAKREIYLNTMMADFKARSEIANAKFYQLMMAHKNDKILESQKDHNIYDDYLKSQLPVFEIPTKYNLLTSNVPIRAPPIRDITKRSFPKDLSLYRDRKESILKNIESLKSGKQLQADLKRLETQKTALSYIKNKQQRAKQQQKINITELSIETKKQKLAELEKLGDKGYLFKIATEKYNYTPKDIEQYERYLALQRRQLEQEKTRQSEIEQQQENLKEKTRMLKIIIDNYHSGANISALDDDIEKLTKKRDKRKREEDNEIEPDYTIVNTMTKAIDILDNKRNIALQELDRLQRLGDEEYLNRRLNEQIHDFELD